MAFTGFGRRNMLCVLCCFAITFYQATCFALWKTHRQYHTKILISKLTINSMSRCGVVQGCCNNVTWISDVNCFWSLRVFNSRSCVCYICVCYISDDTVGCFLVVFRPCYIWMEITELPVMLIVKQRFKTFLYFLLFVSTRTTLERYYIIGYGIKAGAWFPKRLVCWERHRFKARWVKIWVQFTAKYRRLVSFDVAGCFWYQLWIGMKTVSIGTFEYYFPNVLAKPSFQFLFFNKAISQLMWYYLMTCKFGNTQ